ncbi:unnamed protein product [Amoebophrya sp. A25]|nr:unnamed protein product [Amoebophrya sp. A25]|eukprot:GSA25T00022082001.1
MGMRSSTDVPICNFHDAEKVKERFLAELGRSRVTKFVVKNEEAPQNGTVSVWQPPRVSHGRFPRMRNFVKGLRLIFTHEGFHFSGNLVKDSQTAGLLFEIDSNPNAPEEPFFRTL